jgi:hypothetical protein
MKKPRSENRMMQSTITIRMSNELNAAIERAAIKNNMSPASYARHVLAQSSGFDDTVPIRRPRKKPKRVNISENAGRLVEAFSELAAMKNALMETNRQLLAFTKAGMASNKEAYAVFQNIEAMRANLAELSSNILKSDVSRDDNKAD